MNIFNKIRVKKPGHSMFDLSHDIKLSMKIGELVPVLSMEVVPGDRFRISSEAMFRMMPMLSPIMHKVDIHFHNFFVPHRLLWPNWEKFITGGDNDGTPIPAFPKMDPSNSYLPSSLADYLGVPVNAQIDDVSAMEFAAYQRIYHDWYRDQNVTVEDPIVLTDGYQNSTNHSRLETIRKRAWERDYFTSCLPWAQKGDQVELPLEFQDIDVKWRLNQDGYALMRDAHSGSIASGAGTVEMDPALGHNGRVISPGPGGASVTYDPNGSLFVDGQDMHTTTTINELRTAFSLQKWLEKNARAGSRYVETLLAHFGVRSSDKRLQRAEYLGGSKATMAISEVLQTSATSVGAATPQANMAGHGISVSGSKPATFYAEEHGTIMTIVSIRPKTGYYQGLPKRLQKFDRTEFYWPDFAFLGEQPVKNSELYYNNVDGLNDDTFGYIPRYSEYRYQPSRVAGQMATSLDNWHLSRKFATRPHLNQTFIETDRQKRIFAVTNPADDEVVAHIFHNVMARRPIPQYGDPGGL